MHQMMPLPDASTVIAGFSAALKALQTWIQYRDSERAAEAAEESYQRSKTAAELREEAAELGAIVPPDILEVLAERVERCWENYKTVLKSDEYLPPTIDKATKQLKTCLCRELTRIYELNGSIPPGTLGDWWHAYCEDLAVESDS